MKFVDALFIQATLSTILSALVMATVTRENIEKVSIEILLLSLSALIICTSLWVVGKHEQGN